MYSHTWGRGSTVHILGGGCCTHTWGDTVHTHGEGGESTVYIQQQNEGVGNTIHSTPYLKTS